MTQESKGLDAPQVARLLRERLKEVNGLRGVDGSMVITDDGMVVASLFVESMKEDMVAAVASRFVVSTRHLVETLRFGRPSRFLLRTRQGLFSLVSTGRAFLAVVGNPTFNAKDAQSALVASARKIGEILKFNAPKEK
jgi:predicted regulator of Ras-like GTPase activity (Roadblock/LC7/MglB family)